jgi:hypothetical protein
MSKIMNSCKYEIVDKWKNILMNYIMDEWLEEWMHNWTGLWMYSKNWYFVVNSNVGKGLFSFVYILSSPSKKKRVSSQAHFRSHD